LKAWRTKPGLRPDGAVIEDVAQPLMERDEILVRVKAAALNRGDLMMQQAASSQQVQAGAISQSLGLECAGEVVAVGGDVSQWAPGDLVMGRCSGGLAEYAVLKAGLAMTKPPGLEWARAATMHVLVVAHDAVVTNGQLAENEAVLVSAASSGVGVASMQVAALMGARAVIAATTSIASKREFLIEFGASSVVDSSSAEAYAKSVLNATDGQGVDLIADSVGASLLSSHMDCLALEGRLVSIGRLAGKKAELDLDRLALRRIRLIGVTNRTRTLDEQEAMVRRFVTDVVPALADGRLIPCVQRTFPFDDAELGWEILRHNRQLGKVVVEI
jgi:NADPH2:quinone reductase